MCYDCALHFVILLYNSIWPRSILYIKSCFSLLSYILFKLDVKSQQQKQIELAISQGNQQVADELRKQRNQQSGEYLMNLSQQLLTPTAPASLPTTRNCSVRGTGVYKRVTCW